MIRLFLLLGLFGLSLLAVLPAPTQFFWVLAVGATEYGHWFALAPLLLLLLGNGSRLSKLGSFFAILATALFLSSTIRAIPLAFRITHDIASGEMPFAGTSKKTGVLSVLNPARLWLGRKVTPVVAQTLEFADHSGSRLNLRFYPAQNSPAAPCVIVLHTGSWNGGSTEEFLEFNSHLAHLGYAVAVIEYRLAPKFIWPAQREDVSDAVTFLRRRAPELGIDPTRFVLLGRSAGGQIAEAVGYAAQDPSIRGVIAFYAPADMSFAYRYARSDDILNSLQLITDYLGGKPDTQGYRYHSASGFDLVNRNTPPTLLLHGHRDELVWFFHSKRLSDLLREKGVPSYFVDLPWATHAFDFNPRGPGGQISTFVVERFLETVTGPSR
jgi:acetyl esterase/lipase